MKGWRIRTSPKQHKWNHRQKMNNQSKQILAQTKMQHLISLCFLEKKEEKTKENKKKTERKQNKR